MFEAGGRRGGAEGVLSGRSFAVTLTWPNLKNAEYEVVARIVAAATNLGAAAHVVDNDGYPLWSNDRMVSPSDARITRAECEFVISLHFESPRLTDIHSYVALWNPAEFLAAFGYDHSARQLASHNDALSCRSHVVDAHALNLFAGLGRPLRTPLPELFVSLPEPFLEPRIDRNARLFYVGMNWERITGEEGRHHGLLKSLDAEDAVDIFGPEEFQGVRPWEGFKNYRGSIPFDGRSIVAEINRAGVCLAFSSAAHQKSGVMSSRLFEGLAAGAAIIANPHPFVAEHFADCVYVVDDGTDAADVSRQVRAILRDIQRDPTEALRRARLGQRRLRDRFSLEHCLENLFAGHPGRLSASRPDASAAGSGVVHVVMRYAGRDTGELKDMFANVAAQTDIVCDLTLVCDEAFYRSSRTLIEASTGSARRFNVVSDAFYSADTDFGGTPRRVKTTGPAVARALATTEAGYVCVMHPGERWFSDHLSSLVRSIDADPDNMLGCAGKITETRMPGQKPRRELIALTFTQFSAILNGTGLDEAGRFMYRAGVLERLPPFLLPCLDGLEFRALALWAYLGGRMAQTNYATFVHVETQPARPSHDLVPEHEQAAFVRDSVQGRVDWLLRKPELHISSVLAAPATRAANAVAPRLELDKILHTRKGDNGVGLLRSGFFPPEAHFTWMSGKQGFLEFEVPDELVPEQELLLTIGGRKSQWTGADQRCTVAMDDRVVVENVPVREGPTRVRIPLEDLRNREGQPPTGIVRLELRAQHADQVRDADGRVIDARHLGLHVVSLGLTRAGYADEDQAAWLIPDRTYLCGAGGDGLALIGGGFGEPGKHAVPIRQEEAGLAFTIADVAAGRRMDLMAVLECEPKGTSKLLTILVNGETVLSDVPVSGAKSVSVPLFEHARDAAGSMRYDISLGVRDDARSHTGGGRSASDKADSVLLLRELRVATLARRRPAFALGPEAPGA